MFAVLVAAALALGLCIVFLSESRPEDAVARSSAAGDPIAVIAPLPDYVSNGSLWNLDGSGSIGEIVSYTWNITSNGVTELSNATSQVYRFQIPGLYKISLTVVDNVSRTNTAFTAVVAMLDKDQDSLPDWWEENYFGDLDQTATGDYDNDGYDNLEEYASGTDPTVKDPRPTFVQMVKENWYVVVIIAVVIVCAVLITMPFLKKRRKIQEKKKIAAAIAIEKEIEGGDDGKM
jgi:PKD domain